MTELSSFNRRRKKLSSQKPPSDRLPDSVDPDVIPVTVDFKKYRARIGPARTVRWGWRDIDSRQTGGSSQADKFSGWVKLTDFQVEAANPGFFHTYSISISVTDREFFAGEVRDSETKELLDTSIRQVIGQVIKVSLLQATSVPIFPEIWIGFGRQI